MANEKNLKPVTLRTKNEAREMGKKGGIASGKTRRRNKAIRDLFKIFLGTVNENGKTNAEEIVAAIGGKAKKGDVPAFKEMIELLGEKPKQGVDVTIRKKAPEGTNELYKKIRAVYGGETD